MNDVSPFRVRLREVLDRIAGAARRAGRDPRDITLVAVVKNVSIEAIREAMDGGLTDLGESRVQEANTVVGAIGRGAARWHMIGHLQRNKAGRAVELFDRLHGIDDRLLAETLSRRAVAAGRRLKAMVQVNVSGEATKRGVSPAQAVDLVRHAATLPGIEVDGLMTMAPWTEDPHEARPHFARARETRDAVVAATGVPLPELSMGMTADFETAVEEGSTMVRIGTALFGARSRG